MPEHLGAVPDVATYWEPYGPLTSLDSLQVIARAEIDPELSLVVLRAVVWARGPAAVRNDITGLGVIVGVFVVRRATNLVEAEVGVFQVPGVGAVEAAIESATRTAAVVSVYSQDRHQQRWKLTYRYELNQPHPRSWHRVGPIDIKRTFVFEGSLFALGADEYGDPLLLVIDANERDLSRAQLLTSVGGHTVTEVTSVRQVGGCLELRAAAGSYRRCRGIWSAGPTLSGEPHAEREMSASEMRQSVPERLAADELRDNVVELPVDDARPRRLVVSQYGDGVFELLDAGYCFYPLPESTPDENRRVMPRNVEVRERIGPFQGLGGRLWFGVRFIRHLSYDGTGGVGYFSPMDGQYHILYAEELADWSASAILVDGGSVWLGLESPEPVGRPANSIARFDPGAQTVTRVPVAGRVQAIQSLQDRLVVGLSNALCVLEGGRLLCYGLARDPSGGLALERLDAHWWSGAAGSR